MCLHVIYTAQWGALASAREDEGSDVETGFGADRVPGSSEWPPAVVIATDGDRGDTQSDAACFFATIWSDEVTLLKVYPVALTKSRFLTKPLSQCYFSIKVLPLRRSRDGSVESAMRPGSFLAVGDHA